MPTYTEKTAIFDDIIKIAEQYFATKIEEYSDNLLNIYYGDTWHGFVICKRIDELMAQKYHGVGFNHIRHHSEYRIAFYLLEAENENQQSN